MKVIIIADTEDDQDELHASETYLRRDIERALTGALCVTHVHLDLEIALDGFVL